MGSKRVNVLVYSDDGTTTESVRHCIFTFRTLLSPHYAVLPVYGNAITSEPWTSTCALLVIPGGADLPYCRKLNGEGNRRISRFVEQGGAYLGLCAGGYYGSSRCEFEVGRKGMEVVGDRELAFFPGTCRGLAYPGFVYHSEAGARAVTLKVDRKCLPEDVEVEDFRSYYNGGGVFVDAPKYKDKGVEVLASFTEELHVDPGEGTAAVVYCKFGEGRVILTGPHPEFAAANLNPKSGGEGFYSIVQAIAKDEKPRTNFLRACLRKLSLEVNQEESKPPTLTTLRLTSYQPSEISIITSALEDIITSKDGKDYIEDENDTFHVERQLSLSLHSLQDSLNKIWAEENIPYLEDSKFTDYNKVIKHMVIHDKNHPSIEEAPFFDHELFFSSLGQFQRNAKGCDENFGKNLLYGEVVTSTNTLLEKNTQLLRRLPTGFTAVATQQVAGRGRGSNVWVSPIGCLTFSTVVRHEMALSPKAPVVFLQYLAALAIVEGVKTYDSGYQDVPVRLKWPNDIYAADPTKPESSKTFVKVGGILVNSHYSSVEYLSVIGIGLNTTNPCPTTTLSALLPPHLPAFSHEKLLARILTTFSTLYNRFRHTGFDKQFEDTYYKYWLHTEQIVTLETEGGMRARIKGITSDWGLLVAEELGWEDRPTGKIIQLQSDSNSFDFFKGLLKRKV